MPCTPAIPSGVTDHIWRVFELLRYKVAPAPLHTPRQRGRPRTEPLPDPTIPNRPRGAALAKSFCAHPPVEGVLPIPQQCMQVAISGL